MSMDIPPLKYATNHSDYKSAICHCAIPLVEKINAVYLDCMDDNHTDKLAEFAKIAQQIKMNPMYNCTDEDVEPFDNIVNQVIPVISKTYCIREELVYRDIVAAINYYCDKWFTDFIKKLAPVH